MTEEELSEALYFVMSSLSKDATPEQIAAIVEAARAEAEER